MSIPFASKGLCDVTIHLWNVPILYNCDRGTSMRSLTICLKVLGPMHPNTFLALSLNHIGEQKMITFGRPMNLWQPITTIILEGKISLHGFGIDLLVLKPTQISFL